ncbi:MAG: hypothetical protein MUF04_02360 [Akkermansiaceae bacterium]|jgi:hypothetical protein|nr:hypothetical protein [Akkermansiaceae bacterium]
MPHTAWVKPSIYLFGLVEDTPAATHGAWEVALAEWLRDVVAMRVELESGTVTLHELLFTTR